MPTIQISEAVADHLRITQGEDLARAAVEQIALAGYLTGTLSRYRVQCLLGFDNRWDAEEWLGRRGACVQYSAADLETDRANLNHLLGP